MSNTPKIVYRSDSTSTCYSMRLNHNGTFTILVTDLHPEGEVLAEETFKTIMPWRSTINRFFDLVTIHINYGVWEREYVNPYNSMD